MSEGRTMRVGDVPARTGTTYPPEFASRVGGRAKRALGDAFGISSFGVNHVTLAPGAQSSIRHRHTVQDEFVFVVSGELVLVDDLGPVALTAGMCAGFRHGGTAHHLVNRSDADAVYIEIGDRRPGDAAEYPDDDLVAVSTPDGWRYTRRDGTPYPGRDG